MIINIHFLFGRFVAVFGRLREKKKNRLAAVFIWARAESEKP
jgi:hypothetical protein